MNRYLIIPDIENIDEYLELAKKYNLGFEFNDFFFPKMLSDKEACEERINSYKKYELPDLLTSHGDFFDLCYNQKPIEGIFCPARFPRTIR